MVPLYWPQKLFLYCASKLIETAFGANTKAPWQSQQDASRAAAEGCAVLRPSKAAARVLGVLRPAQNVPRGSFEAQYLDDRRGCYVDSVP